MTANAIRRTGLLLALTATLLVAALALIGRAGADDGDTLPAPTGLRVVAERGSLDVSLDWDDVSGAAHYWVRWRVSGPDNKLNDGVQVQSSNAAITVAGYGEWVARVQACDDSGCGAPLAKKFRVRRPRAVPDITPLPTATPTPLPTATPTPEPTATLPTTPTPEPAHRDAYARTYCYFHPTAHIDSRTRDIARLGQRKLQHSSGQPTGVAHGNGLQRSRRTPIPTYAWELRSGGDWFPHGTGPTLSYLAGRLRVLVVQGYRDIRLRCLCHIGSAHRHLG